MSSKIESGRRYFTLRVNPGNLSASIPKGSPVLIEVLQWSSSDLNEYLQLEGFRCDLDDLQFQEFRRQLRKYPSGFKEDYTLLRAKEPCEPEQPRLEWLSDPDKGPTDLVVPNVPFLRVVPPKPPIEGYDVYGSVVLPKVRETPMRIHLQPDPAITTVDEEHYVSLESGQVTIEGQRLRYSPFYTVTEIGAPWMRSMKWSCSVLVTCDLEGIDDWVVNGNLTVEGHWSSGNVTVHGNVTAKSGIQTNMTGVIKVHGEAEIAFVQMSRMGVLGNLTVGSAALQSELRVGGDLSMRGSPGSLLGCTVDVFGGLMAQRAGSEKGQRTTVRVHAPDDHSDAKPSRINLLSSGTNMQVGEKKWTQKDDGFFSTEDG